jgi:hypothetical protein
VNRYFRIVGISAIENIKYNKAESSLAIMPELFYCEQSKSEYCFIFLRQVMKNKILLLDRKYL